jgi:2-keto-4-pentenoate hydratase/2-oxohepta-3-ene-1,7-dioic acid hydratase in catechol pathway
MKLASFQAAPGLVHTGVVDVERSSLFDLTKAALTLNPTARVHSMQALIEAGEPGLNRIRQMLASGKGDPRWTYDLADVTLLAPVPVPTQIRDFSSFPGHIKGAPAGMARIAARFNGDEAAARAAKPLEEIPPVYQAQPIYYLTNRFSVVGPDVKVPWPRYSKLMDFEAEFGIFLGVGGKNIRAKDARNHIFGYTIYNDFSARDKQCVEMRGMLGPTKGKSFDFGNAMGPWIVTSDEIGDPHDLTIQVRVNDETWASDNSGQMVFSFEEMIEYVSDEETLFPGEFFGSGTIGRGCGLEQDRYLKDGDVVEIEVQNIGVLRNRVAVQAANPTE